MPKVVLATSVVVGSIANLLQKEKKRFDYDGYFHNNWVGFPFIAISNEKWCILILSFPFFYEKINFLKEKRLVYSFFLSRMNDLIIWLRTHREPVGSYCQFVITTLEARDHLP